MKFEHFFASVVLASSAAAVQAGPATIYQQSHINTSDRGAYQYSQQVLADDFVAQTSAKLESATWTGSYYGAVPAAGSAQSFTFEIYAGGVTPGQLLYSYVGNASFVESATNASYYEFSMTLANGIDLKSGTGYWVDIYSNDLPTTYAWANSSDGSAASAINYGDGTWYDYDLGVRANHVFALQGSGEGAVVPEPGSIAILGLGLFGLVAARRQSNKAGR